VKTIVPEAFLDLLEQPAIAMFSCIGPNGEPQCTPVWYRWEDDQILVSLLRSRQKFRNIQREPRLALTILDPMRSYRYLEVRGVVASVVDDPDYAFVNAMAHRYMGVDSYPMTQPGDERVIVRIDPVHCTTQG
jgi:PPOX class probable F420-dependent enzyme